MENLTLPPVQGVSGEVNLMGSKSFANRILLLSALADGTTTITNLPDNDDVRHMRNALLQMNVNFELNPDDPTKCSVTGTGQAFGVPSSDLFLGNAGTAMRFLCSVLTLGKDVEYVLTGIPRMYERPIGDLVDALRDLGADITYIGADGYPPLRIQARGLKGGEVSIRGNISSQFITALMLAAPMAEKDMTINIVGELTSKPYVDITAYTMKMFGVAVCNNGYKQFVIKAGQTYRSPGEVRVEGDASSATYFLAAAAIAGGTVRVWGVGEDSVQGDKCFADVLGSMGAEVTYGPTFIEVTRGSSLNAIDIDANHIPDAAMTIATTALFAKGTTVIRNVGNWRLKETDRLKAMATELRKVGSMVVEGEDSIEITPPQNLNTAEIETYEDHRMAMCFSLVCLGGVPITIKDPGCTRKTFPEFFDILRQIFQ